MGARRPQRPRNRLASMSVLLIGFLAGLTVSLYYAWLINPANTSTASAADLRADYRADYIVMVSQAYAVDGNWSVAQERLNQLDDPQIADTTLALLEELLRHGLNTNTIRTVAETARQLGADGRALALFAPTPLATIVATATPAPPAIAPTLLPTPTRASSPTPTATNPPLSPPSPTPQPNYRLLSQQQVCQRDDDAPRIEVVVVNALLEEVPGIEIKASWENNSDSFFTGYKPERGLGYADLNMHPDTSYRLEIVGGSPVVSGLRAVPCNTGEGWQGWVLRFQNLELTQNPLEADTP